MGRRYLHPLQLIREIYTGPFCIAHNLAWIIRPPCVVTTNENDRRLLEHPPKRLLVNDAYTIGDGRFGGSVIMRVLVINNDQVKFVTVVEEGMFVSGCNCQRVFQCLPSQSTIINRQISYGQCKQMPYPSRAKTYGSRQTIVSAFTCPAEKSSLVRISSNNMLYSCLMR